MTIPGDGAFTVEDIQYRNPGSPLLARLYRPSGKGPFPSVVEVHGGVWTKRDRTHNEVIHRFLAANGILVLAIDFRMPPVAKFPAAANDVNFAIRWLKARAEALGTRPALIGGLGTSSGGHLLMLNALRPQDERFRQPSPGFDPGADASLAFAIVCWAVLDPSSRYRMALAASRQDLIDAHHAFWADAAEMASANPQFMLENDAELQLPPLLLIQGSEDDNLTPDMAARFAEAYRQRGGEAELEMYECEQHTFVTRDPESGATKAALERMLTFIRARVGQPG
jgi:acetyl esterase